MKNISKFFPVFLGICAVLGISHAFSPSQVGNTIAVSGYCAGADDTTCKITSEGTEVYGVWVETTVGKKLTSQAN